MSFSHTVTATYSDLNAAPQTTQDLELVVTLLSRSSLFIGNFLVALVAKDFKVGLVVGAVSMIATPVAWVLVIDFKPFA
jgi:hypothetical protein